MKTMRLIFLQMCLILTSITAQTILVKGNVSTSTEAVKNASVIFTAQGDTTKTYTTLTDSFGNYSIGLITDIKENIAALPTKFELAQNYPNPFSNETAITYKMNEPADVSVKIYNVLGQEIRTYRIGERLSGTHGIRWDGKDNFGKKTAAGIYFYMLQAGKEIQVKKMIFGLGSTCVNQLATQSFGNTLYTSKAQTGNQSRADSNNIFKVEISNIVSTQPQIYNKVFENVIIQSDTTINFVVDVLSPWRKIKTEVTWLRDIDFTDSINGWVVGDSGLTGKSAAILHSFDSGENWQHQVCPIKDLLWAVDFVDNRNGWICSHSSILKTTDGGENWNIKYNDDMVEGHFHDIQFLNDKIGFVVGGKSFFGSNGVLLKTTDGGENWQDIIPERLPTLSHISIVDEQNIWICGFGSYGGTLLFTSDLGITWTKKSLNAQVSWPRWIQFIDSNNGWVGCDDDDYLGFFRTTDGGNTWMQTHKEVWPLGKGVQSFFFIDSLHGWLGTVPGFGASAFINTKDGGQTWISLPEAKIDNIASICFINKNLGWAVGVNTDGVRETVILLYKKQ